MVLPNKKKEEKEKKKKRKRGKKGGNMWIGIIIDIIFLVILAVSAYYGYKNGAIKVLLSLLIMILVIPIVYVTYKPVTEFVIKNTSVFDTLKTTVYTMLESKQVNENGELKADGEILPVLNHKINEYITKAKDEHYNNIAEKVSEELSRFVIQIVVMIAWSFILYFILTILRIIIVKVVDVIPIVNVLNYILGSILQVTKILVLIFVILYLLQFVLPVIKSSFIQDNIERTNIIKHMYKNNIINKFIK